MPQQPFILRLHFYTAKGQGLKGLDSAAHHVEYMGSCEKDELLVEDRTSLDSAALHVQYAGERAGSLGYFGSLADRPQAAQKSILQAQGPVWRVIASVGESDAMAMGGALLTKAGWDTATQPVVTQMIHELGLDPAKVQWIAAVHRHQHHENNPHVHLLLWEAGTPSRKKGQWTDQERRAIRRDFMAALYAPEREAIGQEKTSARQEARALIQSQLDALKAAGNRTQGFARDLTQKLTALGQHLPHHGRLAYAYMPPEIKQEVNHLIRWLWDHDPALQAAHDRYMAQAEAMGTFYWHRDPTKTPNPGKRQEALARVRANAEADLMKRCAGPVLKAARQADASTAAHSRPRVPGNLSAVLQRLMHDGERDAARTAYWLAESHYQRRKAEITLAHSTGQEWSD